MTSFFIAYLLFASFLISVTISQDAHGSRLFPGIPADETFATSYVKDNTVSVEPFETSAATALCENGDAFISGGYSIGFSSAENLGSSVFIYLNQPVHLEMETTSQEGWRTGVANNQNQTITITASVLCTDLTS